MNIEEIRLEILKKLQQEDSAEILKMINNILIGVHKQRLGK